jgi:hypothetical protein
MWRSWLNNFFLVQNEKRPGASSKYASKPLERALSMCLLPLPYRTVLSCPVCPFCPFCPVCHPLPPSQVFMIGLKYCLEFFFKYVPYLLIESHMKFTVLHRYRFKIYIWILSDLDPNLNVWSDSDPSKHYDPFGFGFGCGSPTLL